MRTYDLDEAAALLKMSSESLRQRAKAGEITAYKPGKRWVFLETDLQYAAAKSVPSANCRCER